jgi:uncharacterized membrane protein HdeD (DUF308 family)
MEQFELIFKAIKNIVLNFVLTGILAIIIGVLMFIYPDFLGILVGLFLVIIGVSSLIAAVKINKYSKIKIKL